MPYHVHALTQFCRDNADVVDSVANLQLTVATLQSDRFDLLQRIEELQDRYPHNISI
jgi:hypothetical protein